MKLIIPVPWERHFQVILDLEIVLFQQKRRAISLPFIVHHHQQKTLMSREGIRTKKKQWLRLAASRTCTEGKETSVIFNSAAISITCLCIVTNTPSYVIEEMTGPIYELI
jgi:hypothetical protein